MTVMSLQRRSAVVDLLSGAPMSDTDAEPQRSQDQLDLGFASRIVKNIPMFALG